MTRTAASRSRGADGPSLLITYPFPLGQATGGARMTREIARHLGRLGARVKILPVSADFRRGRFPRPPAAETSLGREFDEELGRDSVSVVRVLPHPLHWLLDAQSVRRTVADILRRERVDAVLSYFAEAAFLPSLLAEARVAFGFISTWQSYVHALAAPLPSVPRFLQSYLKRRLLVETHRRAQVLFATSRFTRGELVQAFGLPEERIEVAHLGVDPAFFTVPRVRPERITRLLFFGRLVHLKGVLDAVQALGVLRAKGIDGFRLRFVGQGDPDRIRGAAIAQGVGERVEFHGPLADGALREELARAHLALLPSHFESFGLAFAEAQAAGLAVVAYAAGSVPEIVEDGRTGWLARVGDVEGLAGRLEHALSDPGETFARGLAGRERALRTFTWQQTASTILTGLSDRCGPLRERAAPCSQPERG